MARELPVLWQSKLRIVKRMGSAALKADAACSTDLRATYKKNTGDMRYRPDLQPDHVRALGKAFVEASEKWPSVPRRLPSSARRRAHFRNGNEWLGPSQATNASSTTRGLRASGSKSRPKRRTRSWRSAPGRISARLTSGRSKRFYMLSDQPYILPYRHTGPTMPAKKERGFRLSDGTYARIEAKVGEDAARPWIGATLLSMAGIELMRSKGEQVEHKCSARYRI